MRGILSKFALAFALCLFISTVLLAGTAAITPKVTALNDTLQGSQQPQLPDEDSTFLTSILSAVGGFGGGGLLLIFLVRRFVQNYDDTQKKWEERFEKLTKDYDDTIEKMWEKWEDKYEKLTEKYDLVIEDVSDKWEQKQDKLYDLVEHVKVTAGELKYEALRLKETMVTREMCAANKVDYKLLNERFDVLTEKVVVLETKVG